MSLKSRVRKLENQQRGEDSLGFTWEEFEQVYHALNEQGSDRGAEEPGDSRPAPANINRLLERWRRLVELQPRRDER
jgi:hypothetical protein